MSHDHHDMERSLRTHLRAGIAALVLLGGGMGGWAATTELSGAVVAPGVLVVDSHVKKIQHPTGGVVGEIRVKEGDRVAAGDLLVRLDGTVTGANLGVITKGLDETSVRQGRLEAEREGLSEIVFPKSITARASDPEIAALIEGEQRLFQLRRKARTGKKAQLQERLGQQREQIGGLQEQVDAKADEIKLIESELEGVRELWRKRLVTLNRLTLLEREARRLKGERGQLLAAIAESKGKISETELQILQIDQDLRSEVAKELREVEAKAAELSEKKVAAEDQLNRIEIRAPQTGLVHQLAVHTVGGVVSPGDPLMLIVPDSDELVIDSKVQPQDIDQVTIGQTALLRLSAFSQRTTPELHGAVTRIGADLTQDQKTGQSFYTISIKVPKDEYAKVKSLKLVPGMPVEAFVQTGDRTAMSYLLKPMTDQIARAFKED